MADEESDAAQELGQEVARTGADPIPAGQGKPKRRHPMFYIAAVVIGIIVYALAFQQTDVSLEQITSETRQQSLERILRALARPDLVTYDTDPETVSIDIGVPCGAPLNATDPRLSVTPECASPGETVTVQGTGFDPRDDVDLVFVPDTEFEITLRLAGAVADSEGNFTAELTLPERESDNPQQLQAVTNEPIGTWGNRVEVYTDANENDVEDDPVVGDSGTYEFSLAGSPDIAAVALVSPSSETEEFVSTGESFEAVDGPARGQSATPLGEEESNEPLRVRSVETDGGSVNITLEADPGFDLSGWRAIVYDAATGEPGDGNQIADTIQLSPRVSDTATLTLDKIMETVFLALVATTAGLALAIPLSFVAARNIMRDISLTVTNLVMILLAIPLGAAAGIFASRAVRAAIDPLVENPIMLIGLLVATIAIAGWLIRTAISPTEIEVPTRAERVQRMLLLVLAALAGLVAVLVMAVLFQDLGDFLSDTLGWFGFVGAFFSSIGEILDVAFPLITALGAAGFLAQLASRLGYAIRSRAPRPLVRTLNLVLGAAAGAIWAIIIGAVIDWFYQIGDTTTIVVIPAIVGAVVGLFVAWRGMRKGEVEVGLSIYYAARTVFNTLRSIEPLVMAIVFVVWVGLGPFAGSLALALHTAAALAKLYSEQVESISAGPIEAVRATGANRLQSIVYAVVPQIVPPYISFTMYRWDINVRMSTILGFVGGGGIGSILQQNINLLNYRAASVQMLAIAIVVATMDYASSRMREYFV